MSKPHIWSYPDTNGVKHCLYTGCSVRVRNAYAEWQQRKGAPWMSILAGDVPRCLGVVLMGVKP